LIADVSKWFDSSKKKKNREKNVKTTTNLLHLQTFLIGNVSKWFYNRNNNKKREQNVKASTSLQADQSKFWPFKFIVLIIKSFQIDLSMGYA
jgi:hypothetical protein